MWKEQEVKVKQRQLNKETQKRDKVRRNTAIQRQLFENNRRQRQLTNTN